MDITYSTFVFILLFICFRVWRSFLRGRYRAYFKDRNRQERKIDGYSWRNGTRKNITEKGRQKEIARAEGRRDRNKVAILHVEMLL